MAGNVARRLLQSTRVNSFQLASYARPFSISTAWSKETPSISNVAAHAADAWYERQRAFREKLASSRQSGDSQSHPSSNPSSTISANAPQSESASDQSTLGSLASKAEEAVEAGTKRKGAMHNLIYGTDAGREMDQEIERSFSQTLARGKYVHSIVLHKVKPDKVEEYVDLVGGWYPKVAADPENKVHLVGSWRTEVGDCDTFSKSLLISVLIVHIWEYQKYSGYHESLHTIWHRPEFKEFDRKLRTCINSKMTSLMQEFSFWPTTPPRQLGGVFELRTYTLHPGNLLEWEQHWRKGLDVRREVMEGVGAWFVQIGELNTVHFLWQFPDLEQRGAAREKSWSHEGWADTVHHTVPLIQNMQSRIMVPMPWSPVG